MPEKKNQLWRLDLLETHYLQKPPRYSRTRALLRVKGKSRTHLLPESEDQALREIEALKSDIFAKKLHSSLVKYQRGIKKCLKVLVKKTKDDEKKFLESLDVELVSNVRIIKLIMTLYKLNPKKEEFPSFIPSWIIDVVKDKSNKMNPSNLYNSLSPSNRNIYSKLMNMKDIQSIADIIENSFMVILGAVEKEKKDIEDVETSESSSDEDSDDGNSSEGDNASADEKIGEDIEINGSGDEFAQFDNMVAGSDEDESDVELDETINYNEVTDEEPSDANEVELEKNEMESESGESDSESEDDFFVEELMAVKKSRKKEQSDKKSDKKKTDKKKDKKKVQLPELQIGYVSGSEDEYDDDVVKQITQPKKNRRGQRARQKIWEAKYGRGAKHIQKEKEKVKLEREQKQREYEERVAKRAAKAAITGSNNVPLGEKKSGQSGQSAEMTLENKPQGLHPSWEAKKKQEEALKNVKFSGKKIVF
jgi:hypothetical protein